MTGWRQIAAKKTDMRQAHLAFDGKASAWARISNSTATRTVKSRPAKLRWLEVEYAIPIPYSSAALRQDLERLRGTWDDCQASRDRNAIYGYLNAVYGLVAWWIAEGREADRARRALHLQRLAVSDREDPFASIIRCTADPAKADKRTRSKWSRVMRYAVAYKPHSDSLDQFIRRKGGINACAARFTRNRGKSKY
jgi:hypothetical protein